VLSVAWDGDVNFCAAFTIGFNTYETWRYVLGVPEITRDVSSVHTLLCVSVGGAGLFVVMHTATNNVAVVVFLAADWLLPPTIARGKPLRMAGVAWVDADVFAHVQFTALVWLNVVA
jgi:hypothetical protein